MSAETDLRARLIAERENARTADEIVAAVSPAPTPGVANGARYVVALPFPRGRQRRNARYPFHVPPTEAEAWTSVAAQAAPLPSPASAAR